MRMIVEGPQEKVSLFAIAMSGLGLTVKTENGATSGDGTAAARKAWVTRREKYGPSGCNKRRAAAHKAWRTRKKNHK